MYIHLVFAKVATPDHTGETTALYIGEDPVAADKAWTEAHLNGAYDVVGWCRELRPQYHSTPAKDECPVLTPATAPEKPEKPAKPEKPKK